MGKIRRVEVPNDPLAGTGTTYCGHEYERRPNAEFVGPGYPVHVIDADGGPHDTKGNPAVWDGEVWVVEIRADVPDVDAEVEGSQG